MKALLLAAGRGTRLRPLTERTPKCLVPLAGRPLLEHWLMSFERAGVTEVIVNGHHLAEQVEEWLDGARSRFELGIHFVFEPVLRGTGGTVRDQLDRLDTGEPFYLCHGDNYTNIDLGALARFHAARRAPLTLALFRTDSPSSCGIVEEITADGRILRFVEKPSAPRSNLASAAIFVVEPEVAREIPAWGEVDFSREMLPRYPGRMYGREFDGFNIDVGTPASYALAQALANETTTEKTRVRVA
jgi:mannose-1-phosphate guanylyltransferase